MNLQSALFLQFLGNSWFEQNQGDLGKEDPISDVLAAIDFSPRKILEVGCANGWRVRRLRERYNCEVHGIDPSSMAIAEGNDSLLQVGTADRLPYRDGAFDVIIYGYCFTFIDPDDYFMVLAEGNRVLADSGMVVIWDRSSARPIKRLYVELKLGDELVTTWQYAMDFSRLWLAHPFYRGILEGVNPDNHEVVTVMQKKTDTFPTAKTTKTKDVYYDEKDKVVREAKHA